VLAVTLPVAGCRETAPEPSSTRPVVEAATNRDTALLTDVRAARHEGFDRVVFQFRDSLPGYDVRYVRRPILQDGSGSEVALDGAFVIRVTMENALDADLSDESAPATYTGPNRFSPAAGGVVELARVGGFEGVLTWVAGLRNRTAFQVRKLEGPPRLVVDLANR